MSSLICFKLPTLWLLSFIITRKPVNFISPRQVTKQKWTRAPDTDYNMRSPLHWTWLAPSTNSWRNNAAIVRHNHCRVASGWIQTSSKRYKKYLNSLWHGNMPQQDANLSPKTKRPVGSLEGGSVKKKYEAKLPKDTHEETTFILSNKNLPGIGQRSKLNHTSILNSDATLYSKNKQGNLKNKPKRVIQPKNKPQLCFSGKLNNTKSQQVNKSKSGKVN